MLVAQRGHVGPTLPRRAVVGRDEDFRRFRPGKRRADRVKRQPAHVVRREAGGRASRFAAVVRAEEAVRCSGKDRAIARGDAGNLVINQRARSFAPVVSIPFAK